MASLLKPLGSAAAFIRKNPAIIYSLALIIVLPLFLVIYATLVVNTFDRTYRQVEQEKALALGSMVGVFGADSLQKPSLISTRLKQFQSNQSSVSNISISIPTTKPGVFKIIASSEDSDISRTVNDPVYTLAWQKEQGFFYEVNAKVQDTYRDQWLVVQPVRDAKGNVQALATILIDPSTLINAEQSTAVVSYLALVFFVLTIVLLVGNNTRLFERARLFQELKEVDRMKDEFISIASHELRTPIGAVRGHLSLALEGTYGKLSKKLKDGLTVAYNSVDHLSDLIEDMLEVSRIEQGRIDLEPEMIDPLEAAKAVVGELEISAKQKGLTLTLEAPSALPKIFVDPDRLKQIIVNLLGNSIKYTNKGGITLSIERDKRNNTRFIVEDTGIGIPAEEQQKLFQKFHRVKSEETAKVRGTGLGLWITKRLVELMGGTILLESIEGKGSKFTVSFPETKATKKA